MIVDALRVPELKLVTTLLVTVEFVAYTADEFMVPELKAVITIFEIVALFVYKLSELILFETNIDPVVIVESVNVAALNEVVTRLDTVAFVADNKGVVTLVVARIPPATSSL